MALSIPPIAYIGGWWLSASLDSHSVCPEMTSVAEALFSLIPPSPAPPVAHAGSGVPNMGGPNRELITSGVLLSDNIYLHLLLLHILLLQLHMPVYTQFSNSLVVSRQVKP